MVSDLLPLRDCFSGVFFMSVGMLLDVGHSEEVVKVFTTDNHIKGNQSTSYLNFQDYEKQNTAFTSMAAYTFVGVGMTRGSDTLNVTGLLVTGPPSR